MTPFDPFFIYITYMEKLINILKYTKELRVLYVEDESSVREKFVMMLENLFDSVEPCESAHSAVKLYKKSFDESSPYDIVITDMYMPDINGLELSRTILDLNPDQKILAISAYNDSEVLESLIDLGVSNYIQKPVKRDRLIDIIYKIALDISKNRKRLELKNFDFTTGIKNGYSLHNDIKKLPQKNIILIKLKNLSTIQTIYGIEEADNFINKFISKFKKHFNRDKDLYRLSSKKFAYLIDKEFDLNEAIKTMQRYSKHCKFDIAIGASKDESLIATADMALDFALKHGLEYKIYSKEIDLTDEYKNHILFKSILSNAIEQDTVFPVFHPIYDKEKNIIKYEVLMRISDNKDGKEQIYYPGQFMQISIDSNRFNELSSITIRKAFKHLSRSEKPFSINISYEDIRNEILINEIEKQILKYDNGQRLIFEILETRNIEDYGLIENFISRFKKYGVKIALDDFGAGYSNLNHIINFHSDYVKLDGALIKNIQHDTKSLAIVKAIVSFTKELGIKTIAEYVSSKEIFEIVKDIDVDEFQGFYLSEPLRQIAE